TRVVAEERVDQLADGLRPPVFALLVYPRAAGVLPGFVQLPRLGEPNVRVGDGEVRRVVGAERHAPGSPAEPVHPDERLRALLRDAHPEAVAVPNLVTILARPERRDLSVSEHGPHSMLLPRPQPRGSVST